MDGKVPEPRSVIPLYRQLKDILKEDIESGVWKPGDRIPSENELRQQYDVSRNTVIKALEELVQEGLLRREQGRGTFVSSPKISHSLTGFYSFSNVLKAHGLEPRDVILSLEIQPAKPSVVQHLQLTESQDVWVLKRLRCAATSPSCWKLLIFPGAAFPGWNGLSWKTAPCTTIWSKSWAFW